MKKVKKKYGIHPPFHGKSMESIPYSILKKHGIHSQSHGIHLEKVWSPSPIPWKRYGIHLESPWNPSTTPWKKYGIHPPFHGVHPHSMESTPHSMHSIWNNPGRVKYCCHTAILKPLRCLMMPSRHCKLLHTCHPCQNLPTTMPMPMLCHSIPHAIPIATQCQPLPAIPFTTPCQFAIHANR